MTPDALYRLVGAAVSVAAAAVVYMEGGATDPRMVMPIPAPVSAPPHGEPTVHTVRFLFGGGGRVGVVTGAVRGVPAKDVVPLGVPSMAIVPTEDGFRFAFKSPPNDLIGFGVVADRAPIHWDLALDGAPWPTDAIFAGPYGLVAPDIAHGIGASCLHGFAVGAGTPYFSSDKVGAFIVCHDE